MVSIYDLQLKSYNRETIFDKFYQMSKAELVANYKEQKELAKGMARAAMVTKEKEFKAEFKPKFEKIWFEN